MNPWICALLIAIAGAFGGIVNALLSDNGLRCHVGYRVCGAPAQSQTFLLAPLPLSHLGHFTDQVQPLSWQTRAHVR